MRLNDGLDPKADPRVVVIDTIACIVTSEEDEVTLLQAPQWVDLGAALLD